MTRKFGVSMDDSLAEEVEEPLEYSDSRSDRICDLVGLGLAVEEAADGLGVEIPEDRRARKAMIRQAFLDSGL